MAQHRATSLKDVATKAGVSVATVSRLLNGSLELPAETKARIDAAIRALNYVPNPHARRLSRGRSDTIGLVVPDIGNPFFGTLVAAVEEEADRRGLALTLFATLNRPGREISYLRLLARNHIDGLVFITNHPETDELAELINATGNVVVVDEDVPVPLCRNCSATMRRAGGLPVNIWLTTAIAGALCRWPPGHAEYAAALPRVSGGTDGTLR